MSFSDEIKVELAKKLDPSKVHQREGFGSGKLEYLQGWQIIDEANQVFGFDAWSRRVVSMELLGVQEWEVNGKKKAKCGYRCTVEVCVNGVIRCGTGFGNSIGNDIIDIHELAVKEAETDAMKRAFATFGYRFGLALYDKTREHVGIDTSEDDTNREKIKTLIVNAPEATQEWFVKKYGSVSQVPSAHLKQLAEKLEAGFKKKEATHDNA